MRVAIVNDLPLAIEGLNRAILANTSHTIAWTALDGESAVCTMHNAIAPMLS